EPESHMGIPSVPDVEDRIPTGLCPLLLSEIQLESTLDDRIDEPLLAAEEVIQRRHADADPLADGTQGEVLPRRRRDEVGCRRQQARPGVASLDRRHTATVSVYRRY